VGLCVAFVLFAHFSYATEWQPVSTTSDGIEIFRKETGETGLVAFRGIGVVDAPLPLVATVIFDTGRRTEWIEGLIDSRILRWEDENSFIEYDHIDMPLLFSDRYFVSKIEVTFEHSTKELVFQYRHSDDPATPPSGYLRGEVIDMTFILTSIENETKTRIDARFLADPKGWIPKWLVNFFVQDWPKRTFRNLREEVLKSGISVDRRFSGLLKPDALDRRRPRDPEEVHDELR
jgi:hypothetical protein